SSAESRLERAREWLKQFAPDQPVLVVGASDEAARELLRRCSADRPASFGWRPLSLSRLAARLAGPDLQTRQLVSVGRLPLIALVTRAIHQLAKKKDLAVYGETAESPGFPIAVAEVLHELREQAVDPKRLDRFSPALAKLLLKTIADLRKGGFADRAEIVTLATERVRSVLGDDEHLDQPTLFLDPALEGALDFDLVTALARRAPDALVTLPSSDRRSLEKLAELDLQLETLDEGAATSSLDRLQQQLFSDEEPEAGEPDDAVVVFSAPGEARECVEIARRIHVLAEGGTRFDQVAVLLRSPEQHRAHLEEAFARADIPVHFSRGALRPDPTGRALLALLTCASEGLSARAFAEYLSLGQVPDLDEGAPPPAWPEDRNWVAPDEELVSASAVAEAVTDAADEELAAGHEGAVQEAPEEEAAVAGNLRAPRRWERFIVDAAVIGGLDRWQRRLDGLKASLQKSLDAEEEPDSPVADRLRSDLASLQVLADFALPLLAELERLPTQGRWALWLQRLRDLATRSLRRPERVLSVLSELAPMADVGPVGLEEVRLVLEQRLLQVTEPEKSRRAGRVFVAPVDAARGLSFDVVFLPGLAEKLFPKKIVEEPILLDSLREQLDDRLPRREDRQAAERLLLHVGVGAARRSVVLSYPRLDLDQGRPRVPSFYALEALRAAEGRLPSFDELARRAEQVVEARVGWPAPRQASQAIDEAEHDLVLLESLLGASKEDASGRARVLLEANPHLGRALRARARRWHRAWTVADGLVKPSDAAVEAMKGHALSERSYSPTALQSYSSCPYRFFLYAVLRLRPREVPEVIEEMDPLQKGSFVHEVQFRFLTQLQEDGGLPFLPAREEEDAALLDRCLREVADEFHWELAPAIEKVWSDAIADIELDLREWLRRLRADASGYVPWRFELSFGLTGQRDAADAHSVDEDVPLDNGLRLRGSIDLVERNTEDGRLRVTDYKTGKVWVGSDTVVAGGGTLQPVLYALAVEKLEPEATVESGRLWYCTEAGGFAERMVKLDEEARSAADEVAKTIDDALREPFLPASPDAGACRFCDYQVVCGPYEELRSSFKRQEPLADLHRLRSLR
ncbi:MAG: PD-(D/E)XK nuclease family protein, partial [Acidobacteriota bacterium]